MRRDCPLEETEITRNNAFEGDGKIGTAISRKDYLDINVKYCTMNDTMDNYKEY